MARSLTTLLLLAVAPFARGYMPPVDDVKQAIAKGPLAFVAIANKAEWHEVAGASQQGKLSLTVLRCLKGDNCQAGQRLAITYTIREPLDWAFGVDFPIAKELVLVMHSPMAPQMTFDSNLHGGIDQAFICDSVNGHLSLGDEAVCESIYGVGKARTVTLEALPSP